MLIQLLKIFPVGFIGKKVMKKGINIKELILSRNELSFLD